MASFALNTYHWDQLKPSPGSDLTAAADSLARQTYGAFSQIQLLRKSVPLLPQSPDT